jgi:PAS domain S-box-containing protein
MKDAKKEPPDFHDQPDPIAVTALFELARAFVPTFEGLSPRISGAAARSRNATPEEQIRKAEARYQSLIEQIPAVTFMASFDSGLSEIYVSPHIETLLGYTAKEWTDSPILWYQRLHPADRPRWNKEFARTVSFAEPFRADYRFLAKDGHVVWIHGEARVVRDSAGRPSFVQGIGYDITERREAEEVLRRSREELEQLVRERTAELVSVNAALERQIVERDRIKAKMERTIKDLADLQAALDEHAIVAITDPAGKITFVNEKFCAISKYSREELLGQDHRIINSSHHSKEFIRDLWTTIAHGKVWKGEIKNKARDGSYYWVDTTIVPFLNAQGKPYQYVAIRADITERKRQAEELKRTEALERSNKELQEFARITSHDLQTPLRSISGFAQLLQSDYAGKLDDKADEWINRIVKSCEHLGAMIQDVLDYSRVDAQPRPFVVVSLRDVFRDAGGLLEAVIQRAGGEITAGELPTVRGDRMQLVQLLQNLIENGLKYRGAEAPRVHVSSQHRGDEWIITVRDNGIGIEPKHQERIFEIFKRLHSQQEYPGTGIGLAVCRRIVHRHSGKIWVESKLGQGSDFKFTIPESAVEKT